MSVVRGGTGRFGGVSGWFVAVGAAAVALSLDVIGGPSSVTIEGAQEPVGGLIAYTHIDPGSGASALHIASDGGHQAHQLLGDDGHLYREVAWSSDDQWLFYTAGPDVHQLSLWRIRPDGSDRSEIVSASQGSISDPTPSPDGRSVAFARSLVDGSSAVWTSSIDGTEARDLSSLRERGVEPSFGCGDVTPVTARPADWSPDGLTLLVRLNTHGCEVEFSEILTVDVAADRVGAVVARDSSRPRWSPSGKDIVFESKGVEAADRQGRNRRHVVSGIAPEWSPTGDLAYVGATDWSDEATYGLWVAPGADTSLARLVVNPAQVQVSAPEWSSDGSRIVFMGLTAQGSTLWSVPSAGGDHRRIPGPEQGYIIAFDQVGGR